MWNLQVDHQIMCLSRLDITGNKSDEVIACSWDGQTYIISQAGCINLYYILDTRQSIKLFCIPNKKIILTCLEGGGLLYTPLITGQASSTV